MRLEAKEMNETFNERYIITEFQARELEIGITEFF